MSVPIIAAWMCTVASAQDAPIDAHGFVLSAYDADARDPLTVQRPGSFEAGSAFVGVLFEYARRPVVAADPDSDEEIALLDNLYALNLSMGFAVHSRLRFDVTAPGYAFTGFDLRSDETMGFGIGDTRVSSMVVLVRAERGNGLSIGLVPHIDLPSGQLHAFLGRRRVAGGGVATATYEDGPFTGTLAAGAQIETRTALSNLDNADSVLLGAAVGWMLDDTLGLNAEASGKVPVGSAAPGLTATPIEVLAHLRYAEVDGGAHFTAGAGFGLTEGVGSSRFRVFVGGGFGYSGGPRDKDGDGLVGDADACPREAETRNGYLDEDGCPDVRPSLAVTVSVEGAPVSGARLELDGPVQRRITTRESPYQIEVDPGSIWKGTGSLGRCLEGQAVATISDGDAVLDVPLELKVYGQMRLVVVDSGGEPVADAGVRFVHKDRFCAPPGVQRTDGRGQLLVSLGQGQHQVIIEVEGRQFSEDFEPREGRETELFVVVD